MTTYRKASVVNLVAGIVLIVLGIGGMIGVTFGNLDANLFSGLVFATAFIFVGGYETGKYAEMRYEQRKSDK